MQEIFEKLENWRRKDPNTHWEIISPSTSDSEWTVSLVRTGENKRTLTDTTNSRRAFVLEELVNNLIGWWEISNRGNINV